MFLKRWIETGDAENKIILCLFFYVIFRKIIRYFGLQCLNYDNCFEFCGCQAAMQRNTNVCFENNVPEF
jgi:hypothetical protein